MVISTILYWVMIEAGIAQVASCLPTLRFLLRETSLKHMIHSVVTGISLSTGSRSAPRASVGGSDSIAELDDKARWQVRLHGVDHQSHSVEARATSIGERSWSLPLNDIRVEHELSVA